MEIFHVFLKFVWVVLRTGSDKEKSPYIILFTLLGIESQPFSPIDPKFAGLCGYKCKLRMQGWFSVSGEEKHQRLNLLLTDSQTMAGCRWWWCTFLDNIYTTLTISVVTSERSSKWPQFFSILKILRIWWCCGFKGYCISGKPSLRMIFSFETCRPWPNTDKVATHYIFHLAELAMSCLCLSQK